MIFRVNLEAGSGRKEFISEIKLYPWPCCPLPFFVELKYLDNGGVLHFPNW